MTRVGSIEGHGRGLSQGRLGGRGRGAGGKIGRRAVFAAIFHTNLLGDNGVDAVEELKSLKDIGTVIGIDTEDTVQKVEGTGRQLGEHAIEDGCILGVGGKGGIGLGVGQLPRVATKSQVQENDTQRPDIRLGGQVRATRVVGRLLLGSHVEGGAATIVSRDAILGGETKVGQLE